MTSVKYEQIPVEVIAKFQEGGKIRPLKLMYLDQIYVIDKVYGQRTLIPNGTHTSMQEFVCLICGRKKNLYYDKYTNVWCLIKEIKMEDPDFYLRYENC